MKALIAINPMMIGGESVNAVNARQFYLDLGLDETHWKRWADENILGNEFFRNNVDFVPLAMRANCTVPKPPADFLISIDFAKHIAMMAKTSKSHEYRNYFIDCEKKVNLLLGELSVPQLQNAAFSMVTNLIELGYPRKDAINKTLAHYQSLYGDKVMRYIGIPPMMTASSESFTLTQMVELNSYTKGKLLDVLNFYGWIIKAKTRWVVTEKGSFQCVNKNVMVENVQWSNIVHTKVREEFSFSPMQKYLRQEGFLIV
jgi:phage anti-repressor protein